MLEFLDQLKNITPIQLGGIGAFLVLFSTAMLIAVRKLNDMQNDTDTI